MERWRTGGGGEVVKPPWFLVWYVCEGGRRKGKLGWFCVLVNVGQSQGWGLGLSGFWAFGFGIGFRIIKGSNWFITNTPQGLNL